jgi:hypothetical protein
MKIIEPVAIDDTMLVSTNLTEDDYDEWVEGVSFADKARVISKATHRIFESKIPDNLDNDPDDQDLNSDKWEIVGATNLWKLTDEKLVDQCVNEQLIQVSYKPGSLVNSLALFNVRAANVNIRVYDDTDGEVYNEDYSLIDNSDVTDLYQYYFSPPRPLTEFVALDLPSYASATITITLSVTSGEVACGQIVMGRQYSIGVTQFGSGVGMDDYSLKDRNAYGIPSLVERDYSQTLDLDVNIPFQNTRPVQRLLSEYRAKPIAWVGVDSGDYGMLVFGVYDRFRIQTKNAVFAKCTIYVEGFV